MSQEKLQTMSMQNFGGVKEVHYGIVQVVNYVFFTGAFPLCQRLKDSGNFGRKSNGKVRERNN